MLDTFDKNTVFTSFPVLKASKILVLSTWLQKQTKQNKNDSNYQIRQDTSE